MHHNGGIGLKEGLLVIQCVWSLGSQLVLIKSQCGCCTIATKA
jgi:hypothetical protein